MESEPDTLQATLPQPTRCLSPRAWERMKDVIRQLYLVENLTLRQVRQTLSQHGFDATERQYKIRLERWGFDKKKIKGDLWRAMYMAYLAQHDSRAVTYFRVPLRDGEFKNITFEQILKSMRRNKTEISDVDSAYQILRRQGVQILQSANEPPVEAPSPGVDQDWVLLTTYLPRSQGVEHSSRRGTTNTRAVASTEDQAWELLDYSMTSPNTATTSPCLPLATQFWCEQSPQQSPSSYSRSSPMIQIGVCLDKSSDVEDDLELAVALRQLCINACCSTRYGDLQARTIDLSQQSRLQPLRPERRLAASWATYYISRCHPLHTRSNPPLCTHGRGVALAAFESILRSHSRFVFPILSWMVTILGSNDDLKTYQSFLVDCCIVIDTQFAGQDLNYGDHFHFAYAASVSDAADVDFYGKKLEANNGPVGLIWGESSPNWLVSQYYRAWYKLHKGMYEEALPLMHHCLPISEDVMGRCHTITINCLAIIARAYACMGDIASAISYLQSALDRLGTVAPGLQPYRYRLLRRLALHQRDAGLTIDAECNLRLVMNFRIQHFGMQSESTWNTINPLIELIRAQGRAAEAQRLQELMHHRFDQEAAATLQDQSYLPLPHCCQASNTPRTEQSCCSEAANPDHLCSPVTHHHSVSLKWCD